MPSYDYECKHCSHRFEVFQSMSEEPLKFCPECGKEVRRLITGGSGIIFKGSGFYVTDSKKSSGGKNGKSTPAADSGETKKSEPADSGSSSSSTSSSSSKEPAAATGS